MSMSSSEVWTRQPGYEAPPARPSLAYPLAALLFLALGIFSLGMYFFPVSDRVPESALTFVEGIPSNAETITRAKRYGSVESLSFCVGGYKTYISGYHPQYQAVRAAIQSGIPLKVWIETKKKYSDDSKPLYKLMAGSQTFVSYDDTVQEKSKERHSLLVGGMALLAMGAFVAGMGVFQHRRYAAYGAALRQAPVVS